MKLWSAGAYTQRLFNNPSFPKKATKYCYKNNNRVYDFTVITQVVLLTLPLTLCVTALIVQKCETAWSFLQVVGHGKLAPLAPMYVMIFLNAIVAFQNCWKRVASARQRIHAVGMADDAALEWRRLESGERCDWGCNGQHQLRADTIVRPKKKEAVSLRVSRGMSA